MQCNDLTFFFSNVQFRFSKKDTAVHWGISSNFCEISKNIWGKLSLIFQKIIFMTAKKILHCFEAFKIQKKSCFNENSEPRLAPAIWFFIPDQTIRHKKTVYNRGHHSSGTTKRYRSLKLPLCGSTGSFYRTVAHFTVGQKLPHGYIIESWSADKLFQLQFREQKMGVLALYIKTII